MTKAEKEKSEFDDPRHERFVNEYLIDLNGTDAYVRTYYAKRTKFSRNAAAVEAHKILRNAKIQAYLQKRRAELANAMGITQEKVIRQFKNLAFFDVRTLLTDTGQVKDVKDWGDEAAQAVIGIEVVENWEGKGDERKMVGYTKKIKLESKRAALVSLCEHLGWDIPKKVTLTDTEGNNLQVQIVLPEKYPLNPLTTLPQAANN